MSRPKTRGWEGRCRPRRYIAFEAAHERWTRDALSCCLGRSIIDSAGVTVRATTSDARYART